jgi:MFS family permease
MDVSTEKAAPVLPLFATGAPDASAATLGLMEGIAEANASALKVAPGRLSDRGARKPWAVAGYGLSAPARPLFALAGSRSALFGVYGLFLAFSDGMWKAYLSELAPPEARGAVYGAFNAVVGAATLPANLVAGRLWDAVGHGAPFLLGAAMAALGAGILALGARRHAPPDPRESGSGG